MTEIPDGEMDIYHHTKDNIKYDLVHSLNMGNYGMMINTPMNAVIFDIVRRQSKDYGNYALIYAKVGDNGFITTIIDVEQTQIRFRKPLRNMGITDTDNLEQLMSKEILIRPYLQTSKDSQPRMTKLNEQFITFVFEDTNITPPIQSTQQQQTQSAPPQQTDNDFTNCYKCNKEILKSDLKRHLQANCDKQS